jgi:nucleoside-diphosphate-sugar epimerase
MRIVVTGTTGKLGSEVMKALPKAIPFFREDFNSPEAKLKDADIIIHIAGCIRGSFEELYHGNVATTEILLKNAPKLKRFIYISTAVEFGDYCLTKRSAEKRVKESGKSYIILRPTIIIFDDDDRSLNKLFKLIKRFPVVPLLGGGDNLMQPVYYKDVVQCIINSIKLKQDSTIYIAGKDILSFKDIAYKVVKHLNKTWRYISLPKFFVYLVPFLSMEEKKRFFDNKVYSTHDMESVLNVEPMPFDAILNEVKI